MSSKLAATSKSDPVIVKISRSRELEALYPLICSKKNRFLFDVVVVVDDEGVAHEAKKVDGRDREHQGGASLQRVGILPYS